MSAKDLEGQYAGFLTRAVGLVLDYVIVSLAVIILGLGTTVLFRAFDIDLRACPALTPSPPVASILCAGGRGFLTVSLVAIYPLYYVLFWMLVGQTIGQRIMGVKVVRLDGHNLGLKRSLVRWIGAQICILTFGIGFLWVLVDDRRMGWHDMMARTCVVYSWKAMQKERFIARMNRRRHPSPGGLEGQ